VPGFLFYRELASFLPDFSKRSLSDFVVVAGPEPEQTESLKAPLSVGALLFFIHPAQLALKTLDCFCTSVNQLQYPLLLVTESVFIVAFELPDAVQ
jgi:hypothetical protein